MVFIKLHNLQPKGTQWWKLSFTSNILTTLSRLVQFQLFQLCFEVSCPICQNTFSVLGTIDFFLIVCTINNRIRGTYHPAYLASLSLQVA